MLTFKKRDLVETVLLLIFTFGIYQIYWSVSTKRELNRVGGHIPNAFLMCVPIVHFYFWYMYSKNYVKIVRKSSDELELWVFFLVSCLPFFRTILFQKGFNDYQV